MSKQLHRNTILKLTLCAGKPVEEVERELGITMIK